MDVDICCCCIKDLDPEAPPNYVNFRFQVPGGSEPETILVAVTCKECAEDAADKMKFPGIEAIINAFTIRMMNPELVFTPK